MSPDELRAILGRLGISPRELAAFLGAAPRTGQRWVTGYSIIPPAVATVVRVADAVASTASYSDLVSLLIREAGKLEACIYKGD
jgi:hypothetical protein